MALIEVKLPLAVVERFLAAIESIDATLRDYCFPARTRLPSKPAEADALFEFDPEVEEARLAEEERKKYL
jgi:hypothetical protein